MKFTAHILVTLAITVAVTTFAAPTAGVPFLEDFTATTLDSNWTNHLEHGNTIVPKNGALEIRARANTGALVERSLDLDSVRVSCSLKAEDGSTPVSLFLNWDAADFIQFGLNSPANGRLNICEVLGNFPHDFDLGPV